MRRIGGTLEITIRVGEGMWGMRVELCQCEFEKFVVCMSSCDDDELYSARVYDMSSHFVYRTNSSFLFIITVSGMNRVHWQNQRKKASSEPSNPL